MSTIESEVDLQPVNNLIDEEGEFQRQPEEETEHHEEDYLEGSNREWEEERSSSSFELQSASPKSPIVIPDSPNASAYLTICNPVPLPTPCYPLQELSYTYLRMICSSLSRWALLGAGSSLFSPASSTAGNHQKKQRVTNNTALTPISNANSQSCIQRLVLQVMKTIASPRLARFVFHGSTLFRSLIPRVLETTTRPAITQARPYEALVGRPSAFPQRLRTQS